MLDFLKGCIGFVIELIYPMHCVICGTKADDYICPDCRENVHIIPPEYQQGFRPFRGEKNVSHMHVAFDYDADTRALIHSFKYRRNEFLAPTVSSLMNRAIPNILFLEECDLIIPVPLHPYDLKRRGFNQSELLARSVAEETKIPMAADVLVKTKITPHQASLTTEERYKNLEGAFAVTEPEKINGLTVLLIDDVATTGTTMNECAKALLAAGAKRVNGFAATSSRVI